MKILFVRLKKKSDTNPVPHLGLGILASILRNAGHDVIVLDYLLYPSDNNSPILENVIDSIKPDAIGFSIYTATSKASLEMIGRIFHYKIPIIVGGPHPSLYGEELISVKGISYIVRGEAEAIIIELIKNIRYLEKPEIIDGTVADMDKVPFPDFTVFMNKEYINQYPLQTSRGCPFNCSFCAVKFIASRKWRSRDYKLCVDEVAKAKSLYPGLEYVKIVDDAPTVNIVHFKNFLNEYISRKIRLKMIIDNIRADGIDEELVKLVKDAGSDNICIGVESGNEVVFKAINKSETLDDIKRAANLIKKGGLRLGTCFVIGLPHDNLKRVKDSIILTKELKPDFIFWNMAHPMKKTEIMDWFSVNAAQIYNTEDYSSYDTHTLNIREPVIETKDFTRYQRKKAYFIAMVETQQYQVNVHETFLLFAYSIKYNYLLGTIKAFTLRIYMHMRKKIKKRNIYE